LVIEGAEPSSTIRMPNRRFESVAPYGMTTAFI
jgi:hypothetical protein